MKLVMKELGLGPVTEQEITSPDSHSMLSAVRPHLYRHNFPLGSLKIALLDSNKVFLQHSNSVNIADIDIDDGPLGRAFFHGYVRFDIDYPLVANTNYWLRLDSTGYSFSESAYIGWVKDDPDHRKYDALYSPNLGMNAPLDVEIWARSRKVRQ